MANYRFYNGGDAINARIPFDNPNNDIKKDNIVSYFHLQAPAESFFEVPDAITSGRNRSFSNFDLTIMSKWARFGVVRIDPTIDPTMSSTPVAANDREAKILGDRIHEEYLMQLVQDYVNRVEEAKSQGMTILPAQNYLKHALKKLGIADPALTVRNAVEKSKSGSEEDKLKISLLEQQIAQMQAQQTAFFAGIMGKLTPEAAPAKAAAK